MKPYHLIATVLLLVACQSKTQHSEENTKTDTIEPTWSSKHRELEVTYSEPWSKIASLDLRKKTLFGLIDNTDGKSYLIKITPDVSQEELSDEQYYSAFTELTLAKNEQNVLLEENDTIFHGQHFHQFIFVLHTEKWGVLKEHALIRRADGVMSGFQLAYPIKAEDSKTATMPEQLVELDKNILYESK